MIKCEVIENFTLEKFNELKNIVRATAGNKEGHLYIKDTFECDEEMANYLAGDNLLNKIVVKVLEVKPDVPTIEKIKESNKEEVKPKKKKTSKK